MANVYFSNLKQLEDYREEGFAANMLDVRAACPTLKALLKPEEPGIYRIGKSVPMVRQGDTITIVADGVSHQKAFEKPNEQIKDVITFEEVMAIDHEVLNSDGSRTIIPPMKAKIRKDTFQKYAQVSNYLIQALSAAMTSIITDELGKDNVATPFYDLKKCLTIADYNDSDYEEMARNFLYKKQFDSGVRFAIGDELIRETIKSFKDEYDSVIEQIIAEVYRAFTSGLSDFLNERPCSRYHFEDNGVFFVIERGVDTRIYEYEKERFLKLATEEEDSAIFKTAGSSVQYSAEIDLF